MKKVKTQIAFQGTGNYKVIAKTKTAVKRRVAVADRSQMIAMSNPKIKRLKWRITPKTPRIR